MRGAGPTRDPGGVADYYEILGVARDASTGDIRAAYRERIDGARGDSGAKGVVVANAAELNQAWNVLADPFQRRRYDEQLRGADVDDGDAAPAPAPRPAGRRRPPRSAMPVPAPGTDTDGDTNGTSSGGRGRRPAAPVDLPGGLVAPPTRNRVNALIVDVLLVYILALVAVQFAFIPFQHDALVVYKGGTQVGSPHPVKSDVAAQNSQLLADEKAIVAKATKPGSTPAKVEVKRQKVLSTGQLAMLSVAQFAVALALVVPASARTGQTLGKKIFQLRLVRVDGSPPGWRASLVHYGFPILLAILPPIQPIGQLAAVLLVIWFVRDPLRQGVHDKLAKTFVVTAPKRSTSS
jgi:RDD family protein/DnaJ-like protein